MGSCVFLLFHSALLLLSSAGLDDVRLVKGGSRCAGTVEVYREGQWGTVVQFYWDINDAAVVCRQLECGSAISAPDRAHFGGGSGEELLTDVSCKGTESALSMCQSKNANEIRALGFSSAPHIYDAGVICSGHQVVRLMGGDSHCSGRVEVKFNLSWAALCDADFDLKDAQVVCRELDCGSPLNMHGAAHLGQDEGPIWSKHFHCEGHESFLHECLTSDRQQKNFTRGVQLTCQEPEDVRLVNGSSSCSGRVQVFRWGQWGTVYHRNWDMNDAAVVCRQLDCGSAVSVPSGDHFGEGSGNMVLGDVSCNGTESALRECGSLDGRELNLPHTFDAAVICSDFVRLVGGPDRCSGRVEVKFGRSWATVCDTHFDWQDAQVVCRELDCGSPSALHMGSHFGQGEGPIWSKPFRCEGHESFLHDCLKTDMPEQKCRQGNDVGLICSGPDDLRLVNGSSPCSGTVEVYRWGQWGTVAQYNWDLNDAAVVCRQLGCGSAIVTPIKAHFGQGSGRVLLRDVSCNGSESALRDCGAVDFRHVDLPHKFDAGVICSDFVKLVGGPDRCSGKVEVKFNHSWATVCDADFDWEDAQVVCRELDCGVPSALHRGSRFGQGEGPIWSKHFQCDDDESFLHECLTTDRPEHNCTRGSGLGLICTGHETLRLINGGSPCAGTLQFYRWGQWWAINAVYTEMERALNPLTVAGRHLGCGPLQFIGGPEYEVVLTKKRLAGEDVCKASESNMWECVTDLFNEMDLPSTYYGQMTYSGHRGIRLRGGTHSCSGRLEVQHGKIWGTVCDADFDWQDAQVVCRSLDCGEPAEVVRTPGFGPGEGPVWAEEFQCLGNESHLVFCPKAAHNQSCAHDKDVGLVCFGYTGLRLINGPDRCSGRVHLKYSGKWGTMCNELWDMRTSTVLCNQLKCGHAVGQAWFGEGSGPIWADVFQCHGNETRLSQCAVSPWSRATCSHGQDVGVICSGSSLSLSVGGVRLQSGGSECEGWVEVFHNQTWWRIHKKSWSFTDSSVVCRQLSCGSAVKVHPSGTGEGDRCVTGFQCSGTEAHLGKCSSPQILTCKPSDQVFITCTNHRSLRLVGGDGDCEGRLEIFHKGSWGTVCDDSWGLAEAQVACRQLRCGTTLTGQNPVPAYFGPGSGPIWLGQLSCVGNESSLWDCPSARFEQQDCGHKEDVGIVCSEHKLLRLSEGCSGHTEVYYNGSWGNVCFKHMEKTTATVICRQLGCGEKGKVDEMASGFSPEPIVDVGLKCRPHDSSLWQCPFSLWGQNSCTDSKMAKIHCSEASKVSSLLDFTDCGSSTYKNSCSGHLALRLMGGTDPCSGRVEVYHNGSWGTICDNFWDLVDAAVVCRQLGCGAALRAERGSKFKRGDGPIWLDEVNCRGSELYLWHCSFSVQQSSCSHKQDAGVTCAGGAIIAPVVTGPPKDLQSTTHQSVSAVSSVVFGCLISLLVLLLAGLMYKNWALRKELVKSEHDQLYAAIYEEIDNKYTIQATEKGDVLDEPPSGYEEVGETEGDDLLGKRKTEGSLEGHGNTSTPNNRDTQSDTLEYYNDSPAHPNLEYDDVIVDQNNDYDDVAMEQRPKSQLDVRPSNPTAHRTIPASLTHDGRLREADSTDYDDVGEQPL